MVITFRPSLGNVGSWEHLDTLDTKLENLDRVTLGMKTDLDTASLGHDVALLGTEEILGIE